MRLTVLVLACFVFGCVTDQPTADTSNGSPQTQKDGPKTQEAPSPITIRLSAPNLLFRYLKDGKMHVSTSLEKVPEDQRHAVYIDDLDVSPEDRNSVLYLQRYALSVIDKAKPYIGTPILRSDIEKQIRKERPKPTPKKTPS